MQYRNVLECISQKIHLWKKNKKEKKEKKDEIYKNV